MNFDCLNCNFMRIFVYCFIIFQACGLWLCLVLILIKDVYILELCILFICILCKVKLVQLLLCIYIMITHRSNAPSKR